MNQLQSIRSINNKLPAKDEVVSTTDDYGWFYRLSFAEFQTAIQRIFLTEHLEIAFLKLGLTISTFLSPLLLDSFINNFCAVNESQGQQTFISKMTHWIIGVSDPKIIGLFISLILVGNLGLGLFFDSRFRWKTHRLSIQTKLCLQAYVYSKILKLRDAPDKKIANPLNVIMSDIDTMNHFVFNFHQTWSSVLRFIYSVAMLWVRVKQ